MRIPDAGAPWLAGLPPDASPAAIAMAKAQYLGSTPAYQPYGANHPATPNPQIAPGWDAGFNYGAVPALGAPLTPAGPDTPMGPGAPPPAAYDPSTDPGVIAANAAGIRDRHDAIVAYGSAAGLGADADTSAQAAANPYSTVAQLRQQLQRNLGGINNSANAHGLLFSGANVQGQQNEFTAGAQRSYNAQQALQAQLNGITDKQTAAAVAAAYARMGGAA